MQEPRGLSLRRKVCELAERCCHLDRLHHSLPRKTKTPPHPRASLSSVTSSGLLRLGVPPTWVALDGIQYECEADYLTRRGWRVRPPSLCLLKLIDAVASLTSGTATSTT